MVLCFYCGIAPMIQAVDLQSGHNEWRPCQGSPWETDLQKKTKKGTVLGRIHKRFEGTSGRHYFSEWGRIRGGRHSRKNALGPPTTWR